MVDHGPLVGLFLQKSLKKQPFELSTLFLPANPFVAQEVRRLPSIETTWDQSPAVVALLEGSWLVLCVRKKKKTLFLLDFGTIFFCCWFEFQKHLQFSFMLWCSILSHDLQFLENISCILWFPDKGMDMGYGYTTLHFSKSRTWIWILLLYLYNEMSYFIVGFLHKLSLFTRITFLN